MILKHGSSAYHVPIGMLGSVWRGVLFFDALWRCCGLKWPIDEFGCQ